MMPVTQSPGSGRPAARGKNTAPVQFTAAPIPGGGQGSIPGEELVPAAAAREPAVDKAGAASSAVAASADGRVVKWGPGRLGGGKRMAMVDKEAACG